MSPKTVGNLVRDPDHGGGWRLRRRIDRLEDMEAYKKYFHEVTDRQSVVG